MFARVSEITGPADQLEQGITGFKGQVVPAVRGMDGFVRAYLLVDRAAGKSMSITVWKDEASMRASDDAAAGLRAAVTGDMAATVVDIGHYEIVVSEPAD